MRQFSFLVVVPLRLTSHLKVFCNFYNEIAVKKPLFNINFNISLGNNNCHTFLNEKYELNKFYKKNTEI